MTTKGPRATARKHDWVDERSRALHLRIAEKLLQDPAGISKALANIDRWEKLRGPERAYDEWRKILTTSSRDEIVALISAEGEEATRLRHISPFAGVLTEEERMEIFRYFETL